MNRPSILANLDRVLKSVRKGAPARQAGQIGLFDAVPSTGSDELMYTQVDDWDLDTKLWHERKALGTFVSGHPVPSRRERHQDRLTHVCRDSYAIETGNHSRIVVAGLIRKYDQSRPRIAFITIEDETGTLDLIAFSDEFERFAHCLMENAIIAAQIEVRIDGSRTSLRLVRAFRLGHFRPRE